MKRRLELEWLPRVGTAKKIQYIDENAAPLYAHVPRKPLLDSVWLMEVQPRQPCLGAALNVQIARQQHNN